MPGHEFTAQEAGAQWQIFQQDPGTAVASASFTVWQGGPALGTAHCLVTGVAVKDTQPRRGRDTITNNFTGSTKVVSLRVQASAGVGDPYWYPYLDAGVGGGTFNGAGEVTIPAGAPNGTIALTNSMNGCSLRVYRNNVSLDLKFFHDNNGSYVDHAAMTAAGWTHMASLNSVNTPAKTRGLPIENHVYWDPMMGASSSVALIGIKVAGSWEIYRCVSDGGIPRMANHERLMGSNSTDYTYNWSNDQFFNTRMVVV